MGASTRQHTLLQRMNSSPSGNNRRKRSDQLLQLVQAACQHPPGSRQRQKGLTQLIRLLNQQLWHTSDAYYPDALQQTWIYFCRNLCEATTGNAYDPEVASPVTWLNAYLKRRLQDFQIAENRKRATTVSPASARIGSGGDPIDPIDRLPAPPDVPPLLAQVRAWANADADGTLAGLHITDHPEVTAQALILKRLPPETPWKALAAEYGISIGTLSSFYQRQCLPQLRAFGQSQGYF